MLHHRDLLCRAAPILFLVATSYPALAESKWIRLKSENFELLSSGNARSARDTIRQFEQVRGFFLQALGGPPAKPDPVRLVAFGSAKEYEPYKLNEFAFAYYHQTPGRDYIVMTHGGADIFPVAVHEYVHLLVRHAGLDLPPWLNEGLAELYSTLRPMGDKILVGDLIPGRHRALLDGKWVPLATILAADHASPYYNEKDKAGNLYNEGWALTHMLYFRAEYRPKFGDLLRALADGKDSISIFREVYGKSVEQVEKDLQGYLRGSTFQGALVAAKLDKQSGEIPAEPVSDFDLGLMFADLSYRRGKEAERRAALEKLAALDPSRPEPYQGLGDLAFRDGKRTEAVANYAKAFDRGGRNPAMLWDYGRLLDREAGEKAIPVLSALLELQPDRLEVRLELAETQVRANLAEAALKTLAPIRKVTPAESARFFRDAVYAHLRNGDRANAEATAKRFHDLAKTDADRAEADRLLKMAAAPQRSAAPPPADLGVNDRPRMRRSDPAPSSGEPETPRLPERPKLSGRFLELDCRGPQARMIVETAAARKVFLIEDPTKVVVSSEDGPIEMTCGPQKPGVKVEVGYDTPKPGQGVDGVVRTLTF